MDTAATTVRSRLSYADTVAWLTSAITAAGNTLFAAIDQAAAAKSVGLELRPTTLLFFGNPKGGTPLMAAHPLFALELPLKLLIWDDGDAVNVSHARMREAALRYDVDAADPRIAAMDRALEALAATVA